MGHSAFSRRNIVELLVERAAAHPDRVALRFLGEGDAISETFTYGELHRRVAALAAHLQERSSPGDRALLLYPGGSAYVLSILACFYAGVIAVPAYPPETTHPRHLGRLLSIVQGAQPKLMLTSTALLPSLLAAEEAIEELRGASILGTDALAEDADDQWRSPPLGDDAIAFLQYTSGSTSRPKGVIVGHANLMANEAAIRRAFGMTDDDVVLSWLPLFHDMGLIGGLLQPLYSGISGILLTPQQFIERPSRWLRSIDTLGATVSGGPDFAYRMCADRVTEAQAQTIDLRRWRVAFCGAEPIRARSMSAFAERFAPSGFDPGALYPCYGLAEATLLVTGGVRGDGARVLEVDRDQLANGKGVVQASGQALVDCGEVQPDHRVVVVDRETGDAAPDGRVGEIHVAGPSVARGYFENAEATAKSFVRLGGETYLRTGDLGFVRDGRLFVTGRESDKIIVCGQNFYPQDIERTIEDEVEVVRKGRVVAFAASGPDGEGIGVAAEISPRMQKLVRPEAVCIAIADAVARVHGHPVIAFALLSPGGIPLTSSGKLQRSLCKKRWETQSFESAFHVEGPGAAKASSDRAESSGALTATETKLAELWKDVLGIASVERDDSFFALGGGSLRAAQLRAAIEKTFGVLVPLRAAFEHPTLGALARLLDAGAHGGETIAPIPALDASRDEERAELSDGEARLYFLQKLDPENKAYDLCERFRVRGAIDEARLRACFDVLVARHESLRTTFREGRDGRARRVVAPSARIDFAVTDLAGRPDEARAIAEREAKVVFDLERGPLLRAHLVKIAPEEHELVVVVHHIVSDAWSLRLLVRELCALYDAAGSPSTLGSELQIQYADYAAWQRSRTTEELASSLAYYRQRLGAGREHPVLELPHDRPRPATQSHRGAKHSFTLDAALTQSIRRLGQAYAATPFMVLLAGFQVLLHRYSRQREVRVGVPFANRTRPETFGIFGFFVNTQVLSASLSGDVSVADLLAGARESALAAQDHEALPFERVVTDLSPARSLGHNPLFQALFNHLTADFTTSDSEVAAGGSGHGTTDSAPRGLAVRIERVERLVSGTQFDLSLDTVETRDGIEAEIVYSTDLFEAETIARLSQSYVLVLEAMAKSPPATPIGALPILDAESVRELVEQWNDTAKPYALSRPVHLLIEEIAAASPNAIAVRFGDASLTYAELDARAGVLARVLLDDGVKPDDLVGVCAERSIELVIALIAVLKADGAYLPLEPTYPGARLAHEIAHARPRVVLTQERFRDRLPEGTPVRTLDRALDHALSGAIEKLPARLPRRASVDHLAYCIFTSGSTGKPKAVLSTHRGLVNRLAWMQDAYRLTESDRVLQKTPFTFDVSVWEFFWPLMTGATLVVAPPGAHKDAAQLGALIRDEGITTTHFVPSMLTAFASAGELASCSELRQVFSSGEALSADLAAKFSSTHGARLHNLYGPTEASIDVTSWECLPGDEATPPIGRPIANVALHVLDDRLQPVPVGVAGDLYIAGICLARGYLGAPDLTADRFVPSPFAAGARMYRTGDVARYRRDGAIEYLGRSDHQVKVRGHRIELGEIESRLREHASIADAAVVARADDPSSAEKRLVAYVVPASKDAGSSETSTEALTTLRDTLRAHLESAMPDFMVPQLWVFLPSLPLSDNGKLDRAALPAPDPNLLRKAYVAPSTDAERALAQIWSDVLRVGDVGADDNFFELGGDSIIALQVVGRAKRAGLAFAVKNVFSHQTLRALASIARAIETASDDEAVADFAFTAEEAAVIAAAGEGVEDAFPLSPMQEGLLLHTLLEPGSGIYLMQDAYRLTTSLDVDAFLRAWEGVVARHAALRASFAWKHEGRMLQIIHRTVPSPAEYLDLRALSEADQRAHVDRVLREERESGMDMTRAPLMRVRLVQHGEDSFSFVQSYHHILIDDWCRSLMLVDFFTLYRAYAAKEDVKLAPTRPYRDFIAWLSRQDSEKARAYWRAALEGFESATELSIGAPIGTAKSSNSRITTSAVLLDRDESELLRVTAKRERLTVNTIAQGAWAWVLSQLGGTGDVLFGVTVAGRPAELEGIQDTVGLFINTVPLRVHVPGRGERVASWLGSLFAQNVELREFEWLPLTDVQAGSEIARGEPLFHSLFVFENAPLDRSVHELSADMDASFSGNRTHTNYPITVVVVPGDRYRLQISFDERWFQARDIDRVLASFRRALLFMAKRPEAKTTEIPRGGASEREQMRAWNRTERAYPFERGYFQLFEEQAKKSPSSIAVASGDRQATYAELHERARRIGHALSSRGVRTGSLVVLLLGRGIDGVAAIAGTFAAGGAYLAFDPKEPDGRLTSVLAQAKPTCVIARRDEVERARRVAGAISVVAIEDLERDAAPAEWISEAPHPQQPAYVIFTSGSTGVPKGAVVTMEGMLNNQLGKVPYFGFTERDVIGQTASQSFDISVWQTLTGLLCGARVEIVADAIAHDASSLLDHVERTGITVLESVPSLIRMMLEAPRTPASLRWMIPTGEALPPELARRWFDKFPRVPLVNAYGPAECADDVSLHRIDEALPADLAHVPIGTPTDNNRLFVFDRRLERVAVGVVGEIGVAGVGLGHGYLGDPARTAEVFVPNPFAETPGERLYRTGDRGRLDRDGTFTYVGRADHQVKVRGHRIELGEIESRLAESPEIAACVVVVREIGAGDRRIVAYVVPSATASSDLLGHVRAWLRARLPEYMVPAHVVRLETLPLSQNGKVDRKRLPGIDAAETRSDVEPPETPTEERLAEIWKSVLKIATISRRDSFFDLGGHSLLVTQVASRIAKELGAELTLRAVFEAPVLADLAEKIDRASEHGPVGLPLTPAVRPARIPLSFGQRRIWFMWQMDPNGSLYNLSEAARWRGPLDHEALRGSFERIIARHEALRTTFEEHDGDVFQVVGPAVPTVMPIEDAGGVAPSDRDQLVKRLAEEEAGLPFDLRTGPLLRLRVVDFADDDHVILVTAHHVAADGWSMHLIVDELAEIYAALRTSRAPQLPELSIQYADFSIWQRSWLAGEELERQLAYWKAQLGTEHPVLALPADHPRPASQSYRGQTHRFTVEPALADTLRAIAREHDTTLFTVSLAAFMTMLARYSGEPDVRVGVPVATRQRHEIQSLVGFFVNTHVFRLEVRERETFGALVSRLKEVALGAQAHQELPFERLVETLNPERSLGHSPLFQVLYNHVRPDHRALAELDGVSVAWTERRIYTTEFDMTVDAIEDVASGAVNVSVMYSTDLFERPTIERFADHWQRLLASLGADAGTRRNADDVELRAHTFLGPDERLGVAPLLASYASDGLLLHERIAETARRRGDWIAIRSGDAAMTYGALATRAFALAHVLRSEGITEETRVGVMMDRSPDAIVSLLAVLAAGGVFVPIAPGLPAERLALLLAESGAPLVITRRSLLDPAKAPAGSRALCIEDVDLRRAPITSLPELTRDHAAYVVFTSGSTGTPKGVVVSHGALAMHAEAAQKAYRIDERDTVLHAATFTFDAAIEQWAVPLGAGAAIVLRGEELWTGEEILASVETGGVTVVDLSPGVATELARAAAEKRRLLPQLTCIVGGEALLRASCEQILETVTPRRLVNAYGPTEAAMTPLAWITEGRDVPDTVHAPIGRPLGARSAYVLDAHLAIAAPGVYGELYIGGEGIARGYLGRADLTADRFVPDPFGPPGSRLYRTGDRARVLPDGAVEYAGRSDRQLKLRGFRIEPGEIETALLASSSLRVREAFVHLQTTDGRDPRLVGYVAVDAPSEDAGVELRAHLRARLPEFMVPSAIVALAALPRTPNGKVDVRALPAIERREQEYTAPAEPIAEALASIWQSVLGVARVGIDDNFFELGGDSIIALQAVSRARAAGIAMGPRDIFQHQTVGALATVARWATEGEIDRAPVTGDVPLLPIQAWFFEQELAEPAHYNQSIVLSVPHDLDSEALTRVVHAIVRHHDALRLSFVRDRAGWRQSYRDELPQGLVQRVELEDGDDPESAALRVGGLLQRGLRLADGEVIRFAHLRAPRERGRLVIVAHHLVIDGVSWRILLEDLRSAYMQCLRGDEPVLPPKTASLKRWADAVHAAASVHARELAYWESVVAGAAKDDRQRGTASSSRIYEIVLSAADTSALLGEANRAYRTQVQDLLLAGLLRAWHRARGQSEILVELEGHGRDPIGDVDASRTIGWFTVQYPLLLTTSESERNEGDLGRVISRVKAELRQVPSAGIGYGILRYLTEEGRALHSGRTPDLTFNYLGQTDAGDAGDDLFSIAGFAAGDDIAPDAKLTGDLEVNAFVRDGRLSIGFRYAAAITTASSIEHLAEAYAEELAKLVVHCTSDGAGALVATDFAHANIDQRDLDDLVEEMS